MQRCPPGVLHFKLLSPAIELAVSKTGNNPSLHSHREEGGASLQQLTLVPRFEQLKWKLRFDWSTKSPCQPMLFLPWPSTTCLFQKNSKSPPKGTALSAIKVCRKPLQNWIRPLMGEESSHWPSRKKACLHVSHKNPGLLELLIWEWGQRDRPDQEQHRSQPPIQFFPNSLSEEAAGQFLSIPISPLPTPAPSPGSTEHVFPCAATNTTIFCNFDCSQTLRKKSSNY